MLSAGFEAAAAGQGANARRGVLTNAIPAYTSGYDGARLESWNNPVHKISIHL